MSKIIKTIIGYGGIVDKQNEKFTCRCLRQMVKKPQNIGLPVTANFDSSNVIGKIMDIKIEGNKVVAVIEIANEQYEKILADKVFRPSGIVRKFHIEEKDKKKIFVVDAVDLTGLGVIDKTFDPY